MNYDNILKTLSNAIFTSFLPEDKLCYLNIQLNRIKKRIGDNKVYIGIVGEFSTGKSTLINSLIGADFFVTNAVQGTTTTITKLEYGKKINLKIEYSSGKILRYNKNKAEILQLYRPETYERLSSLHKAWIHFSDMLRVSRADRFLLEIFDEITTSDAIAKTLNEVTIYYPANILNNGIVIVDTPGTDSLNPIHAEITRRAIKEVCDIALVITSATHPLPQTLVDYLADNLDEVSDKCIYFITKIELLRRAIERAHMKKGVAQRITNYLNNESPQVYFAPSLLSLEEKGVIEKTGTTNHLNSDERLELCSAFESDLRYILEQIHNEREKTISDKIRKLTVSLRDELQADITSKENELNEEIRRTRMMRVKPLKDFMNEFYSTHEVYQYSYIESVICNSISTNCTQFKRFVFDEIDRCTTKDATQATMERTSVLNKGQYCFSSCYSTFKSILADMQLSYTKNFNEFKESFTKMFSIDAIVFNYTVLNNPNWQREYRFNYDKSGLTTFKPFRLFKSLSSVKEQMKNDVGPKIQAEFAKMEKYYISCARKSYQDITRQMEMVKRIFIQKYDKIITLSIRESENKEDILNSQLQQLKKNLESLSFLT